MRFANAPVAKIHLQNIRANFELAKSRAPGSSTMPVIKANGYGHGAVEIAELLGDANAFAVARVAEAVALRNSQPERTIVVLEGYLGADERDVCLEHQLVPVIHSDHQLDLLPEDLPFWLKFNTGMFRLGFAPERAAELASRADPYSLLGVCSHFANADEPEHDLNLEQILSFEQICGHFPNVAKCFANSGGILNVMTPATEWVRPGLMLYGGSPSGLPLSELKAGMTLSAPVIALQHLKPGDRVGYGSSWQAKEDCRIAVVALGYADGYPREMPSGSPVLVHGSRRSLAGRVSMDMCTVLLEDSDVVEPGDPIVFWGEDLPIDEIATCAGTISYTLMTSLSARVQREYTK